MRPTAQDAARFADATIETVTKAVADGSVSTLAITLAGMQAAFVAKFTVVAPNTKQLIAKSDEQHVIWGWGNVPTMGGELVEDLQEHVVEIAEVQKAVHRYMRESRAGNVMHDGPDTGTIVDSIVLTKALQDALGIDLGMEGWLVGYAVDDPATWARYQSGELTMFSIEGEADLVKV